MISSKTAEKINRIAEKYEAKISAILPALTLVGEEKNGTITSEDIQDLSDIFEIPVGEVRSIATFYSLFHIDTPVGTYHLQVDTGIPATLMGAEKILKYLEEKLGIKTGETSRDGMFTLSAVEDLASGGTCPVIRVTPYGAAAYAAFYGKRLPTDREWLHAMKGGSGQPKGSPGVGSDTSGKTGNAEYFWGE